MRGSSHAFCVSGSCDGKIEYPICRELSAMVLSLGRATVLRGRLHRGCWSDEMAVIYSDVRVADAHDAAPLPRHGVG